MRAKININISSQTLGLVTSKDHFSYLISTSKYGPGELQNSFCTPRGKHIVRAKIGTGQELGSIFKSRRPTGEIFSKKKHRFDEGDWILTRILWLSGIEKGRNRLGNVDTMQRFIYIHGTPDETVLGVPNSKGCINMANADVIQLFELVEIGTMVCIE
jgi:lipoprotein-anchoring transpeptidase ErfK/SrfK